ncbi:hypothetical protein GIB67_004495, partial [Kingdonia uniflora]
VSFPIRNKIWRERKLTLTTTMVVLEEIITVTSSSKPLGFHQSAPDPELDSVFLDITQRELVNLVLSQSRNVNDDESRNLGFQESNKYPIRPMFPDCAYYLRTGTCGYGLKCRFNHPVRSENQVRSGSNYPGPVEDGQRKENEDALWVPECKNYLTVEGCKFGNFCKFRHFGVKKFTPSSLKVNFAGLPVRPGEMQCSFYMRNGSCSYGTNCKYDHPDLKPVAKYMDETVSSLVAPTSYAPVMFSPPPGMHPSLGVYQVQANSLYNPPLVSVPSADLTMRADGFSPNQQQRLVEEFPQRPGEADCSFFLKNGDCKYGSCCKFHHPKDRAPKFALSPIGLPLRPDEIMCAFYSRTGFCKYGRACRYDHSSTSGALAPPSIKPWSFGNSSTVEGTNRDARRVWIINSATVSGSSSPSSAQHRDFNNSSTYAPSFSSSSQHRFFDNSSNSTVSGSWVPSSSQHRDFDIASTISGPTASSSSSSAQPRELDNSLIISTGTLTPKTAPPRNFNNSSSLGGSNRDTRMWIVSS